MVGGMPWGIHEDGREGMDAPKLVVGISIKMGRRVSRINIRLLSVGFPLREGKVSSASLKRSVIASGIMAA
jgi:hypothetical protein